MTDKKDCEDCGPIAMLVAGYIVISAVVFSLQAVGGTLDHYTFCHKPSSRWVNVFPLYYVACYMGEYVQEDTRDE